MKQTQEKDKKSCQIPHITWFDKTIVELLVDLCSRGLLHILKALAWNIHSFSF